MVETAGFGPGRWLHEVLGSNPDECVNLMFYSLDLSSTLTELAWASLCSSLCCLHTPYITLAKWDLADCTCPSSSLTSLTALARLAQVAQALYKLSKYICPFTDAWSCTPPFRHAWNSGFPRHHRFLSFVWFLSRCMCVSSLQRTGNHNTGNNLTDLAMLAPAVMSLTEDNEEIGYAVLFAQLRHYMLKTGLVNPGSI